MEENMTVKIAINGFGRIGRNVLRAIMTDTEKYGNIDVVSINDLTDAKTLAHLFKYDSVFGIFNGDVSVDGDAIVVNGKKLKYIQKKIPASFPGRLKA